MSDSVRPHRRQPTRLCHPWDSPGKNTGVGCHFLLQCRKVKSESEVTQSCLTLRNPMDCRLPGSSVHGIFQARVLESGAIAFYLFNVYGICSDIPPLSPNIDKLCLIYFFSVSFVKGLLMLLISANQPLLFYCFPLFSVFNFIDICSYLYYFLLSAFFVFILFLFF